MGVIMRNGVMYGGSSGGGCTFADVIADPYSASRTYAVDDFCVYDGRLYICTSPVTSPGDFNQAKWRKTNLMTYLTKGDGGGGDTPVSSGYVFSSAFIEAAMQIGIFSAAYQGDNPSYYSNFEEII